MIDITKFADVLVQHRLTPNQFFMLYTLSLGVKGYEIMERYLGETGFLFDRSEIDDLVQRGYLLDFSNGRDSSAEFDVTDKFKSEFFSDDPLECAEEFWDAYPSFFAIKGRQAVTKSNVNKEVLLQRYAEEIGYSKALHESVMEALEWAKANALISYRIGDFVNIYWRDVLAEFKKRHNRQQLTNETYFGE